MMTLGSLPAVTSEPTATKPFHSAFPGSRIWWLEDDAALCELMQAPLKACGWKLTSFHSPRELEEAIEHDFPNLLLLDQLLPEKTGTQVLTSLRRAGHGFPVLMLSALGDPGDRIVGLEVGADDYLSKPFVPRELELRIEALLRSSQTPLTSQSPIGSISLGCLTLHPQASNLEAPDGSLRPLTRGDTALLLCLAQAPDQVISRDRLARATGTLVDPRNSRSLDVRLSKLRRLLQQLSGNRLSIQAVRGKGYRLCFRAGHR